MVRRLIVAVLAAAIGASAAMLAVRALDARSPGVTLEMDRNLPVAGNGIFPAERSGQDTWVWAGPRAEIRLTGARRDAAWTCTVRFRGGRPADVAQPTVTLAIDGLARATTASTNDFQEIIATAPAAPGRIGLTLGIDSSETFRPAADPRALGVLIDRVACVPESPVAPARGSQSASAGSAALLGAAAALVGAPTLAALGIALVTGVLQAFPLTAQGAAFTGYPALLPWMACWIGLGLIVTSAATRAVVGARLGPATLAMLAGSAAILHLKLIALLHPAKSIVDALYHAHRLDWVLSGRLLFTQTMPSGVEFPYAIALYVVAAPWALLTSDHVALLRVVTTTAEVAAGALLYVMVVRARGDRVMGLLAVALFHAVPIAYPVIGNANLTNAFGQAVALAAVAVAVAFPPEAGRRGSLAVLTTLIAIALLSHVSTFGLTGMTLGCLGLAYWWLGGAGLRQATARLFIALVIASVASVALYWAHFGDTYRTLAAVRAEAAATTDPAPTAAPPEGQGAPTSSASTARSIPERLGAAFRHGRSDIGWPLLALATCGLWLTATRPRDRVTFAIIAWAAAYASFLTIGVLAPVNASYERYSAEFIGRVDLAVYPAVVLLGAEGAAWLWRRRGFGPLLAAAVVLLVALSAFVEWRAWSGGH